MIRKYLLAAKNKFIVSVDNKEIFEYANHIWGQKGTIKVKKN